MMKFHQLSYHGETDTGSFLASTQGILDAIKTIEDLVDLVGGDTNAGIRHSYVNHAVSLTNVDTNLAFIAVLERIRHQVKNDPLPHVDVDIYFTFNLLATDT